MNLHASVQLFNKHERTCVCATIVNKITRAKCYSLFSFNSNRVIYSSSASYCLVSKFSSIGVV